MVFNRDHTAQGGGGTCGPNDGMEEGKYKAWGEKRLVFQYFDLLFIAFMAFQIKEFMSFYIFQKRAGGKKTKKNPLEIVPFTSPIVFTQLIQCGGVKTRC